MYNELAIDHSGSHRMASHYIEARLDMLNHCGRVPEPMPVGWKPEEGRYLRRTTPEERQRFGSPWIAIYRRRGITAEKA